MNNPIQDKLIIAYEEMTKRFHDAVEHAENVTIPQAEKALEQVKEKAIELGELTREEADTVGKYLQRDLQDLSAYMSETQKEFSDWLAFESTVLESKMFEWLNVVADKTRLQWDEFNRRTTQAITYHSGEITGPGTLECQSCKQTLHFKKAGHIPPCPKCHKTLFKRHTK